MVPEDDGWQRYTEAASALAQLAANRVEEIARDLLSTGEAEGELARQWKDDLLERSRSVVDEVVEVVRTEVTRQMESLRLGSPEDLFRRLTETFGKYGRPDRSAPVREAVPIDASSVTRVVPLATKSEATGAASKQRAAKPKGAEKKKPQKKASSGTAGTPHAAAKAAQKSSPSKQKSAAQKAAAKKPPTKKAPTKKSSGRGT